MNDCYWGGEWDQYYYEVDTGRIIGEINRVTMIGTCEAFYFETLGHPKLGRYIDVDRARKAVEACHRVRLKNDEFMSDYLCRGKEPDEVDTPRKTWWKCW